MAKTLKELFLEHNGKVTDKWSFYLEEWDRLFAPYKGRQINLLEIGVQNGGSLEIWAKYFRNAEKIIGCDIDPKCENLIYGDDRIKVIIGDANTGTCKNQILQEVPTFDIIIDDGSHKSSDVIHSFTQYFPFLKVGGIYLVEDVHASYWKDFEGGLHHPLTTMGFFKRIADIVNFEHWHNNKSRASLLDRFVNSLSLEMNDAVLAEIHSVEFLNSLCIVIKAQAELNVLGKRVITGTEEKITEQTIDLKDTLLKKGDWADEDDSNLDPFSLIDNLTLLSNALDGQEQIEKDLLVKITDYEKSIELMKEEIVNKDQTNLILEEQVKARDQLIQKINEELAERDQFIQTISSQLNEYSHEIVNLVTSKSWRYTRPFRKISRFLRGKRND